MGERSTREARRVRGANLSRCIHPLTPPLSPMGRGSRRSSRRARATTLAKQALAEAILDALPSLVADERLVGLEIHAVVAQREAARLHVEKHRLDRPGGVHQRVETQNGAMEAEVAELLHGEDRRVATRQRIADLRHVEGAADAPKLLQAARRLDEDAVGAGPDVTLGAPQGLVEIVDGPRVGARQNPGLRIEALRRGGPDLRL